MRRNARPKVLRVPAECRLVQLRNPHQSENTFNSCLSAQLMGDLALSFIIKFGHLTDCSPTPNSLHYKNQYVKAKGDPGTPKRTCLLCRLLADQRGPTKLFPNFPRPSILPTQPTYLVHVIRLVLFHAYVASRDLARRCCDRAHA